MSSDVTYETFAPLVGDRFSVAFEPDAAPVDVQLTSVTLFEPPAAPGFSLVFTAPPARVEPQGTYRVAHPGIGELDIFVVPVGRSDRGIEYEAVFGFTPPR